MTRPPLLDIRDLERRIGQGVGAFLLTVPELRLHPGDRVAVVGPSGAGKSTLLALTALALRPDRAGRFTMRDAVDGATEDVARLWYRGDEANLARLRARAIGFVPQTGGLLPFLTLAQNIRLTQEVSARPDERHLHGLAKRLGIDRLLGRRPADVSVGQRQRAAIARALAHRPSLILADEPTAAVHPAQADEILNLLCNSADEGAAVLVATHDTDRTKAAGLTMLACQPDLSGKSRSILTPVALAV